MPDHDPFYDEIMATAVQVQGLWPARTPATYGIALDSARPPAQTLPELTDLLNPLWRVSDIAHPDDTHASLQIRSQIDRTCSVHITHHPERNE